MMAAKQMIMKQGVSRNIKNKFCMAGGVKKRIVGEFALASGVQKRILSYMPPYLFLGGEFDTAYMVGLDKGGMQDASWCWDVAATAAYGEELRYDFSAYTMPAHGMDLSCIGEILLETMLKYSGDVDKSELNCFVGMGDDWVKIPSGSWVDLKKYPVKLDKARIRFDMGMTLYEPSKTEICDGGLRLQLVRIRTR